ncbi:MAG: hypothetical protein H8E27_04105 [Verrucomicrobia subdivision 3 bacterium]|nr:hypothetical protein [Limisphaerales bacterium]
MDGSFLSHKSVVAASRKFVCIRLATYENAAENEVLKGIFARGGQLQNTVFGILTPDGKTSIVRAGRSPAWAFGGQAGPGIHTQPEAVLAKMGDTMEAIALAYPGKDKAAGTPPVPYLADLRLALNVAAADRQPLVALYSADPKQRAAMETKLAALAWSDDFIGRAQYVRVGQSDELKAIEGLTVKAGIIVIQPGTFGLTGKVIREIGLDLPLTRLKGHFALGLNQHQPNQLSYQEHRAAGVRAGKRWESKTPNTDNSGPRNRRRR